MPLQSAFFFVIFVKIVVFITFIVFVRVFGPNLMPKRVYHSNQQCFAIFLKVIVVFVLFVRVFGPSHASCHCNQEFFL